MSNTVDPAQVVNLLVEKVLPKMVGRIEALEKDLTEANARIDAVQDNIIALQDYVNQQFNELTAKKSRPRRKKADDTPPAPDPMDEHLTEEASKQAAVIELVKHCLSMGVNEAEVIAELYNMPNAVVQSAIDAINGKAV